MIIKFILICLLFLLFYILILTPFIVITHELGHVIAVKLSKGNILEIHLSTGPLIFRFKKIYIGLNFTNGQVHWETESVPSLYKRIFIAASGCIMTCIIGIIYMAILYSEYLSPITTWLEEYFGITNTFASFFYWIIAAAFIISSLAPLIPYKDITDGASIVKYIKQIKES